MRPGILAPTGFRQLEARQAARHDLVAALEWHHDDPVVVADNEHAGIHVGPPAAYRDVDLAAPDDAGRRDVAREHGQSRSPELGGVANAAVDNDCGSRAALERVDQIAAPDGGARVRRAV